MRAKCLTGTEFPFEVIFWNYTEMMVAQHCEYTKCHLIVYFNMTNFVMLILHQFFKSGA